MKEKIKELVKNNTKLKQFVLDLWVHPYSARTRWWARFFVYPFIIKRGKGSIIRRSARLDLNFGKTFKIGKKSIIEDYVIINNGMGDVKIGCDSLIASRVKVVGPVDIGSNVLFGSGGQVTGLTHNFENVDIPIKYQGVTANTTIIEDDVWIGGNSIIIQGIKIGEHSLVAAGSVVTKDVEPYTIVAGNPARPIKKYDFDTRTWIKI
ncbi:MAG: acyltransferase [Bacteroidales bacterium]